MSPQTEVSTREASDPPDEHLITATRHVYESEYDQMPHCPGADFRCGSMLSKKSKIEPRQKSRKW
jgi:hypothetical protein